MKQRAFNVVVYKDGKHFVSQCLDIDVSSFGNTEQKALEALKEALDLYFEDEHQDSVNNIQNPKLRTLYA